MAQLQDCIRDLVNVRQHSSSNSSIVLELPQGKYLVLLEIESSVSLTVECASIRFAYQFLVIYALSSHPGLHNS